MFEATRRQHEADVVVVTKASHISVLVLAAACFCPPVSSALPQFALDGPQARIADDPAAQGDHSRGRTIDANKTLADFRPESSQIHAGTLAAGYSNDATFKEGIVYTSNVDDAVRALYENRKVVLDQPKTISVLMDKLRAVTKRMIALGERAPLFNLCNVTVRGTNLFCVDSKGIPRIHMPQLDDDETRRFRAHLEKKGYKIEDTEELSSMLRATQNELNGVKVAKIAKGLRKESEVRYAKRLIVSRDNYILDGHHHWAAQVGLDSTNNRFGDLKTRVSRVDISIIDLLREAQAFIRGKRLKATKLLP